MSATPIPYGRHLIDDEDVKAVRGVLEGDWLTTGPAVDQFEREFADYVGAGHGIAVSSGTAALHLSALASDIGPGDEVIVTPLTFAASANCALFVGATVVFADVRADTLTLDVGEVRRLVGDRTKAIITVDYAGLPSDLADIQDIADECGAVVIEDACHAPGATYGGRPVGSVSNLTTFSFHPVKHLTTGEGGMVTTNNTELAAKLRRLRNHGIDLDHRERAVQGTWEYDITGLGFNYRLPDINAALGRSQLTKADGWLRRRQELAGRYAAVLDGVQDLVLPYVPADRTSAWHLYPIRFVGADAAPRRRRVFHAMRAAGVGVNVHYRPVYLHSYYRSLGYQQGLCAVAEQAYTGLLSLPMWAGLDDESLARVVDLFVEAATRRGV